MNTTFAALVAAGLLISGSAIAADEPSGSVPHAPSALGVVPGQSLLNPGVHPRSGGEPGYTGQAVSSGATAGSMDLGRGNTVTTPESGTGSGAESQ